MQKIIPHLWFDKEAKEAGKFYTETFSNSSIKDTTVIDDTPSGSVDMLTIELYGQEFMLISAGPLFKFNPSVSFLVTCETEEEVETLWNKLSKGGTALMPLGEYPFSKKYGWTTDKYGVSWQIMHRGNIETKQRIVPTLMFSGNVCGKTEEAVTFYTKVFKDTNIGSRMNYEKGEEPDKEGTIKHIAFTIENYEFAAMDSARAHDFAFNESISFMVKCDTQEEIDYYWNNLTADPQFEQCGWLKDKYGVSWQIVPTIMDKMMESGDPQKIEKVTKAFLQMKKFNIAELEKAYNS